MAKARATLGPDVYDNGRIAETTKLCAEMSRAPTFEEFLTLPAYNLID
jgi:malate synthase